MGYHLYGESKKKKDTNELIYENRNIPTDRETKLMVTKGEKGEA